ncbi:hypothetical protein M0L20_16950 [Spirosoma sp. RP8]|uniref:Uncharacterized protein n=1 Tax=Spirosoma liriopis TaxID=2937440 RepID=A0ABT0HN47_9BACT|nr:hypothetical protein [Spirosoma liriopis]MCK8493557.1 hypothetical protein [Spirosoma liriopis]
MNGYQLTKAFYDEVEINEAMQIACKAHHHSLFTWICELRNRSGREILDLPVDYTMRMAFIGSQHTLSNAIEDLATWGLIEVLMKTKGQGTKVRLAFAFLQKHCKSDANEEGAFAEMQLQKCKCGANEMQTTKINKTKKTKYIYRGRKKISDESITTDSREQEPLTMALPTDPPPIEPLPLDPPPEPTTPDTSVRLNGKGQMIIPDLPTLSAFILSQGGTQAMADDMLDFYTSKGWMIGKNPMKDWNATARRWIRQSNAKVPPGTAPNQSNSAPRPKHPTNIR